MSAIALVVHALGVRADVVGDGVAVLATVACLAVPRLTARTGRFAMPPDETERNGQTDVANSTVTGESTAGDGGWWARVQSASLTRSALYTGFAATTAVGASAILVTAHPVRLSGLTFAIVCAATLGLYAHHQVAAVERAALAIPAAALLVFGCARAQQGAPWVALVGLGVRWWLPSCSPSSGSPRGPDALRRECARCSPI